MAGKKPTFSKSARTGRKLGSSYTRGAATNKAVARLKAGVKKVSYTKRDNEKTYARVKSVLVEKKYDDDYFDTGEWAPFVKAVQSGASSSFSYVLGGRMPVANNQYASIVENGPNGEQVAVQAVTNYPNCLTNINSGTTSKTRIGNLIDPEWIRIKGVVTAATIASMVDAETTFPTVPNSQSQIRERYCRTTLKIMIIRDRNMNEKGYVGYNDLFEEPMGEDGFGGSAINQPWLWNRKVDTLDRYDIIREWNHDLDQDDPQAHYDEMISLRGYPIKYNGASSIQFQQGNYAARFRALDGSVSTATASIGAFGSSEEQSMTNGIYILAVTLSSLNRDEAATNGNTRSPNLIMSSRLCFTDA